jgi:homospermidine synthase
VQANKEYEVRRREKSRQTNEREYMIPKMKLNLKTKDRNPWMEGRVRVRKGRNPGLVCFLIDKTYVTNIATTHKTVNKPTRDCATKDLRLCMKAGEGKHAKTGLNVNGWYCKYCL